MKLIRILAATCCALLLAGCASTSIQSAWFDATYTGGPMKKIVVVGMGAPTADRRVFEDIFAQRLTADGVTGVPGYSVIPEGARGQEGPFTEAVRATGADGVLIVRLLGVDTRTQVQTTMVQGPMWGGPHGGFSTMGGWGGSGWIPVTSVNQYNIGNVEASLYSARTRQVVWAGTTSTFNPTSVAQETPGFANLIIRELSARGLVPAPK